MPPVIVKPCRVRKPVPSVAVVTVKIASAQLAVAQAPVLTPWLPSRIGADVNPGAGPITIGAVDVVCVRSIDQFPV